MERSRRAFFRALVSESVGLYEESRGRVQCRLDGLPDLPETVLRAMVPVVRAPFVIAVHGGDAWLRDPERGGAVAVITGDARAAAIAARFDGRATLGDIARERAQNDAATAEAAAFAEVRAVFLGLALRGVCHPRDPLDENAIRKTPGGTP